MQAQNTPFGFIARTLTRRCVWAYYGKIEIAGREKIPATGPVLFVANHANSLIDPVMVGITARRPVHFLAKAPLFRIPLFGQILRALGMLPAYRGSDDAMQVHGNTKSLAEAAACLARGETVGIFPEGKSHDALKVDKVRSGAARIAVQAVNEGVQGLVIVPVGINYERKERFRSSVWIRVGEPIALDDWRERIQQEERVAMRSLTSEIDRRLKEVVIHLDEERWEPFIGDLEALIPPAGEQKRNAIAALRQRKRIADAVNYFTTSDRPRAEAIASEIENLRRRLDAVGLNIRSDLFRLRYAKLFLRQAWDLVFLFIGLIPALLGTLYNIVPFLAIMGLSAVLPKQNRSTISLERLAIGLPAYGLWYAWLWFRIADYFLPWVANTWTALMLSAGIFSLSYWPRAREMFRLWLSELRMLLNKTELSALRREHIALQKKLGAMAEDYRQHRPPAPPTQNISLWWWIGRRVVSWGVFLLFAAATIHWSAQWFQQTQISILKPGGFDMSRMSTAEIATVLADEEKALADILLGLVDLERQAIAVQLQLSSGERDFYTQYDNDAIRRLLFSYFSYRSELLHFIWKYQNYTSISDDQLRAKGLTLELAAACALYESSYKFVTQFAQTPAAIRKLNEAEPRWEIPNGAYDTIRANLANTRNQRLWRDGLRSYQAVRPTVARSTFGQSTNFMLFDTTIARASRLEPELMELSKNWAMQASVSQAGKWGRSALYRGQSFLSTWVGDTRIRNPRSGHALIQAEQLEQLRKLLRPGDILVERQNWYLSRAFMPGFWAHAAIYVGTTNDLIALGLDKDPRVQRVWSELERRIGTDGYIVVEAVPRGVRISSFDHCIGIADSAAVLRPRIAPEKLPEVIAQAFVHVGKPYDFEFDFFSTDKLVCTELVYRSCGAEIDLPLVEVLGRKTLPPTELVRKYAEERSSTNAQLGFVAFLDGDEAAGKAQFKDEAAFAETIHRPGLTWLQRE